MTPQVNERGVMAWPRCPYLKEKSSGQIYAWSEALAEKVEQFEPVKGAPPPVDLRNRVSDEQKKAAEPRMALLIEAVEMLDKKTDFTNEGKPKLESLMKLVDENVTLAERDTAFALFNSRKLRK